MVRLDESAAEAYPLSQRRDLVPSTAWLFPQLKPYEPPGRTWAEKSARTEELAASLIETPAERADPKLDHPSMPAGYAWLATFVAHEVAPDPEGAPSVARSRPVRLDLRSIYGEGPAQSYLYDRSGDGRLLVDRHSGRAGEVDLPRNRQGAALIGEPRNDGTLIGAQLHLAMIRFHNAAVSWVERRYGVRGGEAFESARRLARWHFQWVVVHDLLERMVGPELVASLLPRPGEAPPARLRLYGPRTRAVAPLEFTLGADLARYSLLRSEYDVNDDVRARPIFAAHPGPGRDLRGFRTLPDGWSVEWSRFVELDGSRPQPCRRINTTLPESLHRPAAGGGESLIARELVRAWRCGLPSGQDVARALGLEPVRAGADPLWPYILSEAEDPPNDGVRLVGVGARILAEVLIGLVATDPDSFLSREPAWRPFFGASRDDFDLAELLRFAGVPEVRRRRGATGDREVGPDPAPGFPARRGAPTVHPTAGRA